MPLSAEPRRPVAAWERIGASREVLGWMREGVGVEWAAGAAPVPRDLGSYPVGEEELSFWRRVERERLRREGVIEPGQRGDYIHPAFFVPKKGGTFRLVIDLTARGRGVNAYTKPRAMTMRGLRDVRDLARPGDRMIAFDVADGFYHLAIRERERHFFAFWMDEEVWRMAALPMGWSASPATFTAFMHPVFAYLTRASGRRRTGTPLATRRYPAMRGIPYVDDFIFFLGPEDRPAEEVRALLDQLGLAYKEEKCTWTPTTRLYHLGLEIDLERGRFVVPDEKAKAIQFTARDLIVRAKQNRRQVSSRDLASFVGRAMACELAIAPARFFLRALYDDLGGWATRGGRPTTLSRQSLQDLDWWASMARRAPREGRRIWRAPTEINLHTDAALSHSWAGWGAVLNWRAADERRAQGEWEPGTATHIQTLEMRAVRMALEAFQDELAGRHIHLYVDNTATVAGLNARTTRSREMMEELRRLVNRAWELDVSWFAEYIATDENVAADALSRERGALPDDALATLLRRFQEPDLDVFADSQNAVCRRYYTRDPNDTAAEGVNAFGQAWSGRGRLWVHPPFGCVKATLDKIESEHAAGTLIVPFRPHELWWPQARSLMRRCVVLRAGLAQPILAGDFDTTQQ